MVQLFLQVPTGGGNADTDAVKARRSLLSNVEPIIKSVINSGNRYEARLWLCNTISSIHSLSRHDQRELFLDLLEMKNSRKDVAARLLRLIFEKKPGRAGSILARKCHMLEEFFRGKFTLNSMLPVLSCCYSRITGCYFLTAEICQYLYVPATYFS
jgi:hypothetical protein